MAELLPSSARSGCSAEPAPLAVPHRLQQLVSSYRCPASAALAFHDDRELGRIVLLKSPPPPLGNGVGTGRGVHIRVVQIVDPRVAFHPTSRLCVRDPDREVFKLLDLLLEFAHRRHDANMSRRPQRLQRVYRPAAADFRSRALSRFRQKAPCKSAPSKE